MPVPPSPSLAAGAASDTPDAAATPHEDVPMTIWEHLGELRSRLIRALLGIIPGMVVAWELKERLLAFLVAPMTQAWKSLGLGEPTLHFGNPVDPFVAYLKISVIVGLLFSSPWVFYQVWSFVAPGLYAREKKFAIPFVLASTLFFAGGAFFGYAVVFPFGFETLLGMGGMLPTGDLRVVPTIMIGEYIDFATRMLLAFGAVFEVPVVVTFLAIAEVVNWKQLLDFGRWWALIASLIAAILTPPDVGSMMMMLGPLLVLYYLAVGIAYFVGPKPESDAPEDEGSRGAS